MTDLTPQEAHWFADLFGRLVANVELAVLGKDHAVRLALTCLLAEGHLLLEDVPGTGKTSLARALARTVEGRDSRIQFTPDLLPSDVTGVTIYDQRTGSFVFHEGPVFATIVLADEINRASPKTQSALLEVMEEARVTVDGKSHPVGRPFMVIATQNPIEQGGTYRLPEAQLDRFLMKTSLGYPDHQTTVRLLAESARKDRAANVNPVITAQGVTDMAQMASMVHVDAGILDYVSWLADGSRSAPDLRLGLSVRGAMAYVRAAKVWAASQGREYVTPDDIKVLAHPVLGHRLLLQPEAEFAGATVHSVIDRLVNDVHPPTGLPQ